MRGGAGAGLRRKKLDLAGGEEYVYVYERLSACALFLKRSETRARRTSIMTRKKNIYLASHRNATLEVYNII